MRRIKRRAIIIILSSAIVAALVAFTVYSTVALELTTVSIKSDNLPAAFSGFRIAQVSDLHNAEFGEDNKKLIDMLDKSRPDIIAITGDVIDSRFTNVKKALAFCERAVEIAPCYYVTGNHEARVPEAYQELEKGLVSLGVTVLHGDSVSVEREGESIRIVGMDDPLFDKEQELSELIRTEIGDSDDFTVLLSHRPELFEEYAENNIDLALSGHAHGGQIRLPFVGAVIVPNQGIFPKYTDGVYSKGKMDMVVSRGLGNSLVPFRFNCRPETVLIVLESEDITY